MEPFNVSPDCAQTMQGPPFWLKKVWLFMYLLRELDDDAATNVSLFEAGKDGSFQNAYFVVVVVIWRLDKEAFPRTVLSLWKNKDGAVWLSVYLRCK